MEKKIYLDNNASTPLDPVVLEEIKKYLEHSIGNASSIHSFGRHGNELLLSSRDIVAKALKVKSNEILFTSGATESANLFLKGFFSKDYSGHIITSDLEHPCVYKTIQYLESKGVSVTYLKGNRLGSITTEQVENALRPNTKLIALMASNNETGVKTNIEEIAQVAFHHKVHFFTDLVSSLGKDRFNINEGISAFSLSGHKIHAPMGIGLLLVRKNVKLEPLFHGGEQEYGKRPGTENILGIIAFAKAIELAYNNLDASIEKMKTMRDHFENKLLDSLQKIFVNGLGERICNTTNICFEGIDGEVLLAALDQKGIAASHGSACSSGALEPSRILINMGLSSTDARSSIRFSLSRMNTIDEVDQAANSIIAIVKHLRSH